MQDLSTVMELNSTCVVARHADHVADCPGLEAELGLVEGVAQPGHRGARLGPAAAPRVQYLTHDSARVQTIFSSNLLEKVLLQLLYVLTNCPGSHGFVEVDRVGHKMKSIVYYSLHGLIFKSKMSTQRRE